MPQKQFCQVKSISYKGFCAKRRSMIAEGLVQSKRSRCLDKAATANVQFLNITPSKNKPVEQVEPNQLIELNLPYGITLRIPAHVSR